MIVELAKEWGGIASLLGVVSGLAVGRYQLAQAIADVKELKKNRIDDVAHSATQKSDFKHMQKSVDGISETLTKLADREYKKLSDAARGNA